MPPQLQQPPHPQLNQVGEANATVAPIGEANAIVAPITQESVDMDTAQNNAVTPEVTSDEIDQEIIEHEAALKENNATNSGDQVVVGGSSTSLPNAGEASMAVAVTPASNRQPAVETAGSQSSQSVPPSHPTPPPLPPHQTEVRITFLGDSIIRQVKEEFCDRMLTRDSLGGFDPPLAFPGLVPGNPRNQQYAGKWRGGDVYLCHVPGGDPSSVWNQFMARQSDPLVPAPYLLEYVVVGSMANKGYPKEANGAYEVGSLQSPQEVATSNINFIKDLVKVLVRDKRTTLRRIFLLPTLPRALDQVNGFRTHEQINAFYRDPNFIRNTEFTLVADPDLSLAGGSNSDIDRDRVHLTQQGAKKVALFLKRAMDAFLPQDMKSAYTLRKYRVTVVEMNPAFLNSPLQL